MFSLRHTAAFRSAVLLLWAAVACACGKTLTLEEPSVLAVSDEPIAFAVDGQMTKGDPVTTLAALAAQQFSVSAWYSPDGQAFSAPGNTGYLAYKNHRFGYVTDDLAGQTTFPNPWQGANAPAGGGVTKDPIYWPFSGTLSFFCYAPYRVDAVSETPPDPDTRDIVLEDPVTDAGIVARLPGYLGDSPLIRVTPAASASAQADLLVAPPLLDKSRFYFAGQSQLDFSRHRMVQVEFQFNQKGFVPDAEKVAVRVTGINLSHIIGSKYLYFTRNAQNETGCAWSDAVSPADPANLSAPLPQTSYGITAAAGELVEADLPERNGANDNHIASQTQEGVLFLLPQTLPADAEVEVAYALVDGQGSPVVTGAKTYALVQPALTEWPEGKRICYKLTLDLTP